MTRPCNNPHLQDSVPEIDLRAVTGNFEYPGCSTSNVECTCTARDIIRPIKVRFYGNSNMLSNMKQGAALIEGITNQRPDINKLAYWAR